MIGETISSDVSRRYSDFSWLYNSLEASWPTLDIPMLPPKSVLTSGMDPAHVQRRQRGLQRFLDQLCASAPLLASRATIDFLSADSDAFRAIKESSAPTAAGRAATIVAGAGNVVGQFMRRTVREVATVVGGADDLHAAGH